MIKASIVIPAYNEEKYIENSLHSLLKSQQSINLSYEVILVDNNSTDNTVKLASKFKDGMNLKIINESKQGRGAARARGFNESKGEIILSADADTIFHSGWIEELVKEIKGEIIAVTTSCKMTDSSLINNTLFNFFQPISMVLYKLILGHYWLSGFSFGIKKEIYKKAGGFNINLQAQEDTELSFRIAKLGKIKFINKPVIVSGRRFKDGLFQGILEYLKSYMAVLSNSKDSFLDNPR